MKQTMEFHYLSAYHALIWLPASTLIELQISDNIPGPSIDGQSTSDSLSNSECLSSSDCSSTSDCLSISDCLSTSDCPSSSGDVSNSNGFSTDTGTSCVPNEEIDESTLEEILKDQQTAWQDATDDTPIDPLEPSQPLDNQM